MFILKGINQLTNAITKAKKIRPRVEFDAFGRYRVSGSKGGFYTVICKRSDNDYKLVECTCQGGESGSALLPRRSRFKPARREAAAETAATLTVSAQPETLSAFSEGCAAAV